MAEQLAAEDSASQLAIDHLRRANPLILSFSTQQIQTVLDASSHVMAQPLSTTAANRTQIEVERRCGRPFKLNLEDDRNTLFLLNIYRDFGSTSVNLQFVQQTLFKCIFSALDILVLISCSLCFVS
jgi:hypothetical protein